MNLTPEMEKYFLDNNPTYQTWINSELQFAESEDYKFHFLERIGIDMIKMYLYFNWYIEDDINLNLIDDYFEFLDYYNYPPDEHFLTLLRLKELNIPIDKNKHIDISQDFKDFPDNEFRLDSEKFLSHLCQTKTQYIKVFKSISEFDVDIHFDCYYPFQKCAKNGHLEIVKYLVEQGANIHADNDQALRDSAKNGHLDVVKYLVEKGANIHAKDDDALNWSAARGHLEVVKYLVEHGADIHAYNDNDGGDGDTLVSCVNGRHFEVMKYLMEQGANIHAYNDRVLSVSSFWGDIEIVKYLVEHGANIHANNNDALRKSVEENHFEVIQYLVEQGADVKVIELNISEYLIEHGAKYKITGYDLYELAENKRFNLINFLIINKVDIHMNNDIDNDKALKWSAEDGYLEVVKYLIEQEADIHADNNAALRKSAQNGHFKVVEYLIEKGANVDVLNE